MTPKELVSKWMKTPCPHRTDDIIGTCSLCTVTLVREVIAAERDRIADRLSLQPWEYSMPISKAIRNENWDV